MGTAEVAETLTFIQTLVPRSNKFPRRRNAMVKLIQNSLIFSILLFQLYKHTFASSCCSDLLLDVDQGSEVHSKQGDRLGFYKKEGMYGARPQYRQVGGGNFLFYLMEHEQWFVTSNHVGNSSGSLAKLTSSYCPEGLTG